MNLSYSINNWNIGIAYSNPFKTTARSTLVNGEYEQYTSSRIPRITEQTMELYKDKPPASPSARRNTSLTQPKWRT